MANPPGVPPASGGRDTVRVSIDGPLVSIVRLFTLHPHPDVGRDPIRKSWISVPQLTEVTGLPRKRVRYRLSRVADLGFSDRRLSGEEVIYLRQCGIIQGGGEGVREVYGVTFEHARAAFDGFVSPDALAALSLCATQPVTSRAQPSPGEVRSIRERGARRVRLMAVDDALLSNLRILIPLDIEYGFSAKDVAALPHFSAMRDQFAALTAFFLRSVNLRRTTKRLGQGSITSMLNYCRAYLGWFSKTFPLSRPSLANYLDGPSFQAFLSFLAARGGCKKSTPAAGRCSAPGTASQVGLGALVGRRFTD